MLNVVIIGGHGKVALRLAQILARSKHSVTSVIRDPSHSDDITAQGATPKVLSLEDDSPAAFTSLIEANKADVVYFSAGSGGKGGEERTKKVDYEGAVKIFDAIEAVKEKKPFLILVSGVEVRDFDRNEIPSYYNEADKQASEGFRKAIPAWIKWKYQADLNLSKRTAFKWFILRPGGFSDEPGTGKVTVGKTHITDYISRDDVAEVLAKLATKEHASGLALEVNSGAEPLEVALDAAIAKGETAFVP